MLTDAYITGSASKRSKRPSDSKHLGKRYLRRTRSSRTSRRGVRDPVGTPCVTTFHAGSGRIWRYVTYMACGVSGMFRHTDFTGTCDSVRPSASMLPLFLLPFLLASVYAYPIPAAPGAALTRLGRTRSRSRLPLGIPFIPSQPRRIGLLGRLAGSRTEARASAVRVHHSPDTVETWQLSDGACGAESRRSTGRGSASSAALSREEMIEKAWAELLSPPDTAEGVRSWFDEEFVGELEDELSDGEAEEMEQEVGDETSWWRRLGLGGGSREEGDTDGGQGWEEEEMTTPSSLFGDADDQRAQARFGVAPSQTTGGWVQGADHEWYLVHHE
ncbi:uncharacterized protein MKK02DRAFT_30811 [Dioszegia hungarica]|uniref:Uncharacterized protein n=1 Tax=Dioszegia hungarica TaxID=4972 RepID=A0AA38H0S2_9TREE|nr:uncharacterized protein MKK02DRAFT_30811 [Dioszegia hungarica]KAI9631810.1 hypothetical protein MKK02DRAFT_30811 [Dioszegia hungarica]